jgi:RHS repeat-associated protein
VFGTDVDAALLETEGGYVQADGLWWTRSGRQVFDPAQFYAPVTGRDPFGNEASVVYDAHRLFVTEVTDALGNTASFEHDYRVLAPYRSTDPNGNRTQVGFDTFGRVVWMALLGTDGAGEGDTPEDPTATFSYDVFAWRDRGEPLSAYGRAREEHANSPGGASTRWQESWTYFDGSGATLLAKANAEPGDAPTRDEDGALILDGEGNPVLAHTDTRFVGSGRTVFDNKGNPVRQYEPYFSSTSGYEDEAELREQGVSPLVHYDPLGRVVRTDFPDGTHARVEFGPWTQVSYDQGDTVVGTPWEAERLALPGSDPDRRAATLSASFDGTPTVTRMDALGRAVRVVTENVNAEFAETRMVLDIVGNALQVIDARGNVAQENVFGMAGQALQESSVDAGWRRAITDVVGNPLRGFSERGFTARWRYDAGLRPTHQYVAHSGTEVLTMRTVYGESLGSPEASNLRGQAYRVYDGAGVQTAVAYDFKGGLLAAERQLAVDYTQTLDWSALAELEDVTDLEAAAAGMLESEVFRTESTFDALGRPTTQTTPDGSVVRLAYNEAALLEGVSANVRGAASPTDFVSNIDYDAKGRRTLIAYGNGTQTSYSYDSITQRLTRLRTTDSTRTFQDLAYTYDVVGNIVEIGDGAQADVYFGGAVVTATQRYEYDALYRLIQAEGREHAGQNAAQPTEFGAAPSLHPQDGTAMRTYTEQYVYDVVGNILSMQHGAVGGNWTRRYQYAADGNYLMANSGPGDAVGTYSHEYGYDLHGNMTSMPHLGEVVWNFADQMRSADLGGGGMAYFVYDAAGQRVRKVRVSQNRTRTWERIYLGAYELYRERTSGSLQLERETLHIADDGGRMCDVETRTVESGSPVASPTTHHRYQYSNHLGSASLELTASAEVISYEEYHPYGTSAYRAVNSSIDVSERTYRYTGKERDEETGLGYHGARYYACWLGRWTASDPIGLGDGVNRYAYVSGRPVNLSDPGGTKARPPDQTEDSMPLDRPSGVPPLSERDPELASRLDALIDSADQGDPGCPVGGCPVLPEETCPVGGCRVLPEESGGPSGSSVADGEIAYVVDLTASDIPVQSTPERPRRDANASAFAQGVAEGVGATVLLEGFVYGVGFAFGGPAAAVVTGALLIYGAVELVRNADELVESGARILDGEGTPEDFQNAGGLVSGLIYGGVKTKQSATGGTTSGGTRISRLRQRARELGEDPDRGTVDVREGISGVRLEGKLGRQIRRGESGADFVDDAAGGLGEISLKGPLPRRARGNVQGLIKSAVKDLQQNGGADTLVIDLTGLSATSASQVRAAVNSALPGANFPKNVVFLGP